MIINYSPKGVCSNNIAIEIENNIIKSVKFTGGCNGNGKGVASLCKNRTVDDVISALKGIKCGFRDTSCPDQLANALIEFKEQN